MKKIVLILTSVLIIGACSDDKPEEPTDSLVEDNSYIEFFEKVGCNPNDPKSIKSAKLFVDGVQNEKYLYGSRIKDNKESFWRRCFKKYAIFLDISPIDIKEC